MSSITLPLKAMLVASAFAGLTLFACGEDAPAAKDTDTDQDEAKTEKDAGKTKDAGKPKDAGVIPQAEPGDECEGSARAQCTGCGAAACFTTCEDDVYGECKSLVDAIRDGGLAGLIGDATIPNFIPDGGSLSVNDGSVSVKFGDASVTIPGTDCPDTLECSNKSAALGAGVITALAMGAPVCLGKDAIGFPPACTTNADCVTAGLKAGMCLTNYCVQVCK